MQGLTEERLRARGQSELDSLSFLSHFLNRFLSTDAVSYLTQGHALAVQSPQITTKRPIKARTLYSQLNFHCLRYLFLPMRSHRKYTPRYLEISNILLPRGISKVLQETEKHETQFLTQAPCSSNVSDHCTQDHGSSNESHQ
jgi:hypothetical protein